MSKTTMRAVIFKGPKEVAVEERPIPKIQDPTDVIVKVGYTALCGRYVLFLPSIPARKSSYLPYTAVGDPGKSRIFMHQVS